MAGFRLCLLVTIVLATGFTTAQDFDPCLESNHVDIYHQPWRNVNYPCPSSSAGCDRYLDELWYRFHTGGDDSVPTAAVTPGFCGTNFPIWFEGDLPENPEDGIKNMTACVSTYNHVCEYSWSVDTKTCDGFHVYNLKFTPGCPMAYCIGTDLIPTTAPLPETSTSEPGDEAPSPDNQLKICTGALEVKNTSADAWKAVAIVSLVMILLSPLVHYIIYRKYISKFNAVGQLPKKNFSNLQHVSTVEANLNTKSSNLPNNQPPAYTYYPCQQHPRKV